jgi:hypothetical protein
MDNGIVDAKKAVLRFLTANTSLKIAYENDVFTPPVGQFLATDFFINSPEDPVFTAGYHRDNISFNIYVHSELGKGSGASDLKALELRNLFKKGTTFIEGQTKIHILRTPRISSVSKLTDRLFQNVTIDLTVEVYQ